MPSSTWTKSDYAFFAEVVHNTPMSDPERIYLSNRFGDIFANDNARFDWERWNAAIFEGKLSGRGGHAQYGGWSRKTYEMTAAVLKGPDPNVRFENTLAVSLSEDTRVALISAFGAAFERDNPSFNWERFRQAAGSPYAPSVSKPQEVAGYYYTLRRDGGYRRVRVRQHYRSKPGGPKKLKYVSVRAHNREVK